MRYLPDVPSLDGDAGADPDVRPRRGDGRRARRAAVEQQHRLPVPGEPPAPHLQTPWIMDSLVSGSDDKPNKKLHPQFLFLPFSSSALTMQDTNLLYLKIVAILGHFLSLDAEPVCARLVRFS